MKALNFKVTEKLYDELKKVSEENNIPMASLIRIALTQWLASEKKL